MEKKGVYNIERKLGFYLFGFLIIFITSLSINPAQSSAQYTRTYSEAGRLPATPADALNSKIDVSDAFTFAGDFAFSGTNPNKSNHAYLSLERPNVVILYDGVNPDQRAYVWYKEKLSLNADFEFEAYVFLSNAGTSLTNGVPDGMTFTLQNDPSGIEAIGGSGGGLGVYPRERNSVNMIYQSVTVELDTFSNSSSTDITNYDKQIVNNYPISWPHAAVGSTYVPDFKGYSPVANAQANINQAYDGFDHKIPTVPSTRAEGNTWFKGWKKLNVKWHPLADGINGELSYTFDKYPTQTTTVDIDKYFNYTNSKTWDRKVNWGFTGSNGMQGNTFGVLMTKLPQEPGIDVDRKVRNVTKNETDFRTSTVADIGDELEYNITVKNKELPEIDLPLKKTSISENLKQNAYVDKSFTFNNSLGNSTITTPEISIDKDNNLIFEDDTYTYKPGQSFNYSYKVKVDDNTKEFINNVSISSTYTTEGIYGETSVFINPKNISLTKASDNINPKVGDQITINLQTAISNGKLVLNSIRDKASTGMEIVPNSTYLYYKNDASSKVLMKDSDVWDNQILNISNATLLEIQFENGITAENNLIVEYKVKINSSIKGQTILSNKANLEGQNVFQNITDKRLYEAESNDISTKIKTDVVINFLDHEGILLDSSLISSSNAEFNNRNPVTVYLNTEDEYDYTNIIEEISKELRENENLIETNVQGELASSSIPKEGATVSIQYSSNAVLTIEFINEANQVLSGYTVNLDTQVGNTIDLTKENNVQTQILNLANAGYDIAERPSNESAVNINNKEIIVQYKIQGVLSLTSVPNSLDFGTLTYDAMTKRVEDPSFDEQLVVTDTRADAKNGWRMTASLSTPMRNSEGQELVNALRYMNQGKETILSQDAQVIYTNTKGTAGSYAISDGWGKTSDTDGIKLQINSSDTVYTGDYVGVITWKVMAGQP